jgi:hypothetical protein
MHTDEQFTHALSAAFRSTTDGLTYHGPVPTPSKTPLLAAPVALAGAVGVGLAIASAGAGGHTGTQPATASGQTTSDQPTQAPPTQLVSRTVELAGLSFTYQQAAGDAPLYAQFIDSVPADAKPLQTNGTTKAYVGVDPKTGYQSAFVVTPSGKVLAITSPDATQAELTTLVQSSRPQAVPLVGGTDS